MIREMKEYKDIDEYLENFAAPSQKILQNIRETIKNTPEQEGCFIFL